MSNQIREAERPYVVETTTAIHPDCGKPYVWEGECFACGCEHPEDRLLDTRDIYIEWDERWSFGAAGELLHHRVEIPETCWEVGCEITVDPWEVACWVHLGRCWCDERGGDEHPAHD